jgi:glycosyltransferase involved in cell wall biosynthesis
MRVLLTAHQFLPHHSSGTEVLTYESASGLIRRGHQVRVLAGHPATPDEARATPHLVQEQYKEVPVERLYHSFATKSAPVRSEYEDREQYQEFRALLQRYRPELVHVFHACRLSTEVVHAAKDFGVPVVFTATDFWSVCSNSQLKRYDGSMCTGPDWAAANCAKCYLGVHAATPAGKKMVELPTVALWAMRQAGKLKRYREQPKFKLLDDLMSRPAGVRRMLARCDRIIAPTRTMFDMLRRNGVPAEKMRVSHYGLNVEYMRGHTRKTPSEAVRIGFMGTLYEHKGVHVLLEAFKKLQSKPLSRPATLDLWGDPTHFPQYAAKLRDMATGVPGITFRGTFPNDRIGHVFDSIDLLVIPSVWYENAPLVLYSANATKTPVAATDLGSLAELIHHDQSGLLFPRGDADGLAAQLRRAVEEHGLLDRLRANTPPVKTMDENVAELEALYRGLLSGVRATVLRQSA